MMILLMILLLRPNISRTFTPHYILGVTGAVAVAGVARRAAAAAASTVVAPLDVDLVGLRLSHGQQY